MKQKFISDSPEVTKSIGVKIGKKLIGGETICLYGDLGAGKTSLAQGILQGAEITEKYPRSPTFSIINQYSGRIQISHIDLYRIDKEEQLLEIGFDELLCSDSAHIIEWAEKAGSLKPHNRIDIFISPLKDRKNNTENDTEREILIEQFGNIIHFDIF